MTRTYTRYFGDELDGLDAELVRLRVDFHKRIETNRWVDPDVKADARERLEALELAAKRMRDRVPE